MFNISLIRVLTLGDKEFEIIFDPKLPPHSIAVTDGDTLDALKAGLTTEVAAAMYHEPEPEHTTPASKAGVGKNATGYAKFQQLGCTREQLTAALKRDGAKLTELERQATQLAIAGMPVYKIAQRLDVGQSHAIKLRRDAALKLGFTPRKKKVAAPAPPKPANGQPSLLPVALLGHHGP